MPKKISIFRSNVATSDVSLWKSFLISDQSFARFNFKEPIIIQALVGARVTPATIITIGLNYQIENNQFVESGNSQSVSEFSITNNTNSSIFIWVVSDKSVLTTHTILANESLDYRYHPSFYIHATEDLDETVLIQNVNTQISSLGIKTADVSVEKENEIYSFSLVNIVSA